MKRFSKFFAYGTLAVMFTLTGSVALHAEDRDDYWRDRDRFNDRRDLRHDYRDLRGDYAQIERLRADVQRDQWRLNEDIRCGRDWASARDAADLARDRRALDALERDAYHDRADIRRDRHDWYQDNWRYR